MQVLGVFYLVILGEDQESCLSLSIVGVKAHSSSLYCPIYISKYLLHIIIHLPHSIFIPELLILHIRQIREFYILLMLDRVLIPLMIFPQVVHQEENRQYNSNRIHRNDGNLRRHVFGSIVIAERQRSKDITETKAHQEEGIRGYFFGMALE